MFTSAFRFLAALLAVFVLLTAMWVSAAHATEFETFTYIDGQGHTVSVDVATTNTELVCVRRALVQGTVGEGVVVCDNTSALLQAAPRGTARAMRAARMSGGVRVGVTTVHHMGVRG